MERFVKGDVVVAHFPYSDLTSSKRRPALVVVSLSGDDLVLCAISSQPREADIFAIEIKPEDFSSGALSRISFVRCDHIFTGDSQLVEYKIGTLKKSKTTEAIDRIVEMLKNN